MSEQDEARELAINRLCFLLGIRLAEVRVVSVHHGVLEIPILSPDVAQEQITLDTHMSYDHLGQTYHIDAGYGPTTNILALHEYVE